MLWTFQKCACFVAVERCWECRGLHPKEAGKFGIGAKLLTYQQGWTIVAVEVYWKDSDFGKVELAKGHGRRNQRVSLWDYPFAFWVS